MGDFIQVSVLTQQSVKLFAVALGAFLLAMALTPIYTYIAYKKRFWKKPRTMSTTGEELQVFSKLHAAKHTRNIPTMAGLIFVVVIIVVTLLVNLDRGQTWLPLAALIGGAVVGLIDDIINIKGNGTGVSGLRSSIKFALISAVAVGVAWYFFAKLGYTSVHVPFVGDWELGWVMLPLAAFAIVATGNAVNLTDGLDGLAGGLAAQAYAFFGIIAMLQGNYGIAAFCFTIVGTLLSYVWFNIYPARFFMGDVGSFALGMGLAVVAMLTNTLLLLPVIGLLFVVEVGSSLVQITSKRFFGKKILLSAPLHHHLEAIGWPETKVTMRFWVIGAVAGFGGLLIALAGGSI